MATILRKIEYRCGMLERGMSPDTLPIRSWRGNQITEEIRAAISDEGLLRLGGVYGDPDAGDPVEYDHLRLVCKDEVVTIEVFNRGITLFTTNDERVVRIHRSLCKLDKE